MIFSAPGWLTDLLRPKRVEAGRSLYADYVGRDGHAYALAAVRGELGRMSAAAPGTRNQTAYRVACRLIELCRADWASLDTCEVQDAYLMACDMANTDGQFMDGEAWAVWFSAERKIQEPAVLPAAEHLGTVMPWVDTTDFDHAGQDPAPVTDQKPPGPVELVALLANDPFEAEVTRELSRLLVREEAGRRHAARNLRATDFGREALDDAGLAALPAGVPLVDGYLERDTLVRVNGPSGHGKSFVVLDLAACVSRGRMWHGRAVTSTRALYVIAEGARGMSKRVAAWCLRHGLDSTGVVFTPRAVQIGGPEWTTFTSWCTREGFGLIVIDTQARATVGVKENDATEMGEVVARLDDLRTATGACVLLVHHRGLSGDHGRGSTAMRGAMDAEFDVSRTGTTVTVRTLKMKDGVEPAPLMLTMNPVGDSVVLIGERDQVEEGSPFVSPRLQLSGQERACIAIAHALMAASGSGLTRSEATAHARIILELPSTDTVRKMIRRAWADLVGLGRIAKAAGREAYFWIDLEGMETLAANPDKSVDGGPEVYVPKG